MQLLCIDTQVARYYSTIDNNPMLRSLLEPPYSVYISAFLYSLYIVLYKYSKIELVVFLRPGFEFGYATVGRYACIPD